MYIFSFNYLFYNIMISHYTMYEIELSYVFDNLLIFYDICVLFMNLFDSVEEGFYIYFIVILLYSFYIYVLYINDIYYYIV